MTRGKIVFDHVDITWFGPFCHPFNQVVQLLSAPQRLIGFLGGGEDPLSNVNAGAWLPTTVESAESSARYTTPKMADSRVACVTCASKNSVKGF